MEDGNPEPTSCRESLFRLPYHAHDRGQSSLLSTISTAFVIQVQNDGMDSVTVALLSQLVLQGNQNATLPLAVSASSSSTSQLRLINAFLYTSLALSIANVTLGVLCLQWMEELVDDAPAAKQETYCDLRVSRFGGFIKGARPFVLALPLILLCSLVSFLGGFLAFLGIGDWVVAAPVYIVLAIVLVIGIVTTLWPTISTISAPFFEHSVPSFNPPYRSIQSWITLQVVIKVLAWFHEWRYGEAVECKTSIFPARFHEIFLSKWKDWLDLDVLWASWFPEASAKAFLLPASLSVGSKEDMDAVFHCFDEWKNSDGHVTTPAVSGAAGGRELSVLRYLASETRIRAWETRFMEQFVRIVNCGTSISALKITREEARFPLRSANLGMSAHSFQLLSNHLPRIEHADFELSCQWRQPPESCCGAQARLEHAMGCFSVGDP